MAEISLNGEAAEQLDELVKLLDREPDETVAHIVGQWHMAYIEATLPAGFALRDDLTLGDIERYFELYAAEKPETTWGEYGRTLRAAVGAGWFSEPTGLDPAKLSPAVAPRLWRAVNAHYVKLTTADPN